MSPTDAQRRARDKWLSEKVDTINLRVPKGEKVAIQEHAAKCGESVNAFLYRAAKIAMMQDNAKKQEILTFKSGDTIYRMPVAEILYLESGLRKVIVHTVSGNYTVSAKLGDLLDKCPGAFIRCHQSYSVNPFYVAALEHDSFRLQSGSIVPISHHRLKETRSAFMAWAEDTPLSYE